MGWFGAHEKRRRRIAAAMGVVALVGAAAGTAWAAKPDTMPIAEGIAKFEIAKTFEVPVPAGYGIPGGAEPSSDGSNWPSVEWWVGDVKFETRFVSTVVDPTNGVFNWALIGPRISNEGPRPVTVVTEGDGIAYTPSEGTAYVPSLTKWLAPGEFVGGWEIGWWGELANTGDWTVPPTSAESAIGEVEEIAITAEGGVTASGFYTWSFFYTHADQTGHFVFALQMRGTA